MKLRTPLDDARIPEGFVVREYDEATLDPGIRASGCLWVARHEGLNPDCDWYSQHQSYPAAVLAARGHAKDPCLPKRRTLRFR